MLRRALPIVLAAIVVGPVLAQTRTVSPTTPQRAVGAQAPATYFPSRSTGSTRKPKTPA